MAGAPVDLVRHATASPPPAASSRSVPAAVPTGVPSAVPLPVPVPLAGQAQRPLRIGIVAALRFPVAQPFAGGLEAHTWSLARSLTSAGHHVVMYAHGDSDRSVARVVPVFAPPPLSEAARADIAAPPEHFLWEHRCMQQTMSRLLRDVDRLDLVHNNSLHYLPLAMASLLSTPMVTTLHTPPNPWQEAGAVDGALASRFVAVSADVARRWAGVLGDVEVVGNGVDPTLWPEGPGGGDLVWSGRLVPEKAPHLAVQAARLLGRRVVLAGPVHDQQYFDSQVAPLLGDGARYAGHLGVDELARLVGGASCALVTPCWDEPFGLVAAEAMLCGTPVAAFDRGGLGEVLGGAGGVLAAPDDVADLARAVQEALAMDRSRVRAHALATLSASVMAERYVQVYRAAA
ncbi:glycosyltransferase [Aquipuribacter hungaricus]|uniref:Glycosyltransferase n=1 Tax=Aquipuribacter hungaricus TaxID=545624 RepID=A0ABV7WJQ0_9MICO